jgi:hypothetical protein
MIPQTTHTLPTSLPIGQSIVRFAWTDGMTTVRFAWDDDMTSACIDGIQAGILAYEVDEKKTTLF